MNCEVNSGCEDDTMDECDPVKEELSSNEDKELGNVVNNMLEEFDHHLEE